ncbi:MAG TPA: hypothetical protein VFF32_15615 [Dermatophilaceae bacterium]|nr:hypothetical protein [Dermatophilaceae bacterium]
MYLGTGLSEADYLAYLGVVDTVDRLAYIAAMAEHDRVGHGDQQHEHVEPAVADGGQPHGNGFRWLWRFTSLPYRHWTPRSMSMPAPNYLPPPRF